MFVKQWVMHDDDDDDDDVINTLPLCNKMNKWILLLAILSPELAANNSSDRLVACVSLSASKMFVSLVLVNYYHICNNVCIYINTFCVLNFAYSNIISRVSSE